MSKETDHILAASRATGLFVRITPGGYWRPGSTGWHGQLGHVGGDGTPRSLALDLAPRYPGRDTPELLAVFNTLWPYRFQLRELYYSGPGAAFNVYRGRVTAIDLVPKSIRDDHHDHVHTAVPWGVYLQATARPVPPAQLTPLPPPTHYPGDKMTAYQKRCGLGNDGSGYDDLVGIPKAKLVSVVINGANPDTGTKPIPSVAALQVNAACRVAFQGGIPNTHIDYTAWVAD